ncbi:MAG: cell wall-binding repeat-containing protein [Coriobacteriales bacterium]|jgi:putative cell wall-binding protein
MHRLKTASKGKRAFAAFAATIAAAALVISLGGMALASGGTLSGSGTESDPYLIEDAQDLVKVSSDVNAGTNADSYYKLANDIDMSSVDNFTPIGNYGTYSSHNAFSGTFDGDGHTISNLNVSYTDDAGLFGYVSGTSSANAVIENLTVSGTVEMTGTSHNAAAGIAAYVDGYTTISNCRNMVNVTSDYGNYDGAGGIIGKLQYTGGVTVDSCVNEGTITSAAQSSYGSANNSSAAAGGIVGYMYYPGSSSLSNSITNCYNTGTITTTTGYAAGGIVGYMYQASSGGTTNVENCYNTGTVSLSDAGSSHTSHFGGIAGYFSGSSTSLTSKYSIVNCYSLDTAASQLYPDTSTVTLTDNALKTSTEMSTADFVTLLNASQDPVKWYKGITTPKLSWEIVPGAPTIDTDLSTDLVEYNVGDTATALTISASKPADGAEGSDGTLSYQWYSNSTNDTETGTAISGATSETYTPSTATSGETYYYCVVTNTYTSGTETATQSITSSVAHIVVHSSTAAATPTITTQPASQDGVAQDAEVTLSIGASVTGDGAGVLSYQWYESSDNAVSDDDTAIEGATSESYVPDTSAIGTTYYYCVVTNTFEATKTATATSDVAQVTVKPVEISTAEELAALSTRVSGGDDCDGKNFVLTADIDLSGYENWSPIGESSSNPFSGSFDGQGYKVTGLNIETTASYAGLFGYIENASISNLTVSGNVSGTSNVGGVVGNAMGDCTLTNLGNEADVTGTGSKIGGIIGHSEGYAFTFTMTGCFNRGAVSSTNEGSTDFVGGVIGQTEAGTNTISECYNTGTISASGYTAGGILGGTYSYSGRNTTISDSYNAGVVSAATNAGAISGHAYYSSYSSSSNLTLTNCYYDSDVADGIPAVGDQDAVTSTGKTTDEMMDESFLTTLSSSGAFVTDLAKINSGYPIFTREAVEGQPLISANPEDVKVAKTGDATMSVTAACPSEPEAAASGTLSYQWYTNKTGSEDISNSTAVEGATSATLTVPTDADHTGVNYYFCVVTNTFGDQSAYSVSFSAKATVISSVEASIPNVVVLTNDVTYTYGETAEALAVLATASEPGNGTLTYQWYKSDTRDNNVETATLIEGATSAQYTPETSTIGDAYYFCVVTNTFEDVKTATTASSLVKVTVTAPQISTPEELNDFAATVNSGVDFSGVTVTLANDIDMTDTELTSIGSSSRPFAGTFEGNGYKISGITSNEPLFTNVEGGTIENLDVEATISSSYSTAGVVYSIEDGTINNVSFSGSVNTSGPAVAGIAGTVSGTTTIDGAENYADITSTSTSSYSTSGVAGIVGISSDDLTITNCANYGDISGYLVAGGIIGRAAGYPDVSYSLNRGSVTITGTTSSSYTWMGVGGIAGGWQAYSTSDSADIVACYNTGTISATTGHGAGGIVGWWKNSTSSLSKIDSCYNAGTATVGNTSYSTNVGGIFGRYTSDTTTKTTLSNCYYLEESTIGDASYGTATAGPGTTLTALPVSVTSDQLTGAADLTVDTTTQSVLTWLNTDSTYYKADATDDAAINNSFPVLTWEQTEAAEAGNAVVTISPEGTSLTIMGSDGHKYSSYTTNSDGARVYELPVGDYTWEASASGYLSDSGSFSVTNGADTAVSVSLIEAPTFKLDFNITNEDGSDFAGTVKVTSDEFGDITLDSDYAATVKEGTYSYTVTEDGYRAKSGTVTVFDDDATVDITMEVDDVWDGSTSVPSNMSYNEEGGYYEISVGTPSELAWVSQAINDEPDTYANAHITLTNDIALNEEGSTENTWTPLDTNSLKPFCGEIDGQGHKVTGMYVGTDTSMYGSFVGIVGGDDATIVIKNLIVEGDVEQGYIGAGIVGGTTATKFNLTIENCGNEADVTVTSDYGFAFASGIITNVNADSESTISISGCYNKGEITATAPDTVTSSAQSVAAGIVGIDRSGLITSVENCYNTGKITSTINPSSSTSTSGVAGILGVSSAAVTISNCYNAGEIVAPTGNTVSGSIAGMLSSEYAAIDSTSYWVDGTATAAVGTITTADNNTATKVDNADALTAENLGSAYKEVEEGVTFNNGMPVLAWETVPSMLPSTITVADMFYTGSAVVPDVVVTDGDATLAEDTDYTLVYKDSEGNVIPATNLIEPGTYTAAFTGMGNYSGTREVEFSILIQLSDSMVADIADIVYTGEAVSPEVKVTDGETELVVGTDYTVAYKDADGNDVTADQLVGPGDYTAVISGTGTYGGTVEKAFSIEKTTLTEDMVASVDNPRYTGEALAPAVSLKDGDTELVEGTDFTVAYKDAEGNDVAATDLKEIGSYTVVFTGTGKYEGTVETTFDVLSQYSSDDIYDLITNARVDLASTKVSADGTDVTTDSTWVTQEQADALKAAADEAKSVVSSGTATEADIQNAGDTLQSAVVTFETAVQNGTKVINENGKWTRLSGTDRYGTMKAIVDEGFESADTVIVASGENFPDALSASGLAGIYNAPVILTKSDSLSPDASAEITRLGATKAIVVGGSSSVSNSVVASIEAQNVSVTRVSGKSRVETSLAIYNSESGNWGSTAIIANGYSFADALSISSYAYSVKAPIFLADESGNIDSSTLEAITEGGFDNVIIVGGTGAVSSTIETNVTGAISSVTRLGGANRYATSAIIAEFGLENGMSCDKMALASGKNFPDALAGAALCSVNNSVLLLVDDSDTSGIDEVVAPNSDSINSGYLLGGSGAVSSKIFEMVNSL